MLRSLYSVTKNRIIEIISGLLDANDVQFKDEAAIEEALYAWKETAADFADCLIGAKNRRLGCLATVTSDLRATKLAGFVAA